MIEPPIPKDEAGRLASLRALQILDTPSEERFDRVTRLARRLLRVPIALVSMVDAERQWFKSRQGLDATETPRAISFCGHSICQDDTLVVPDATRDARFSDNPLVTGDPWVRFYAGQPLRAPDGAKVGTLCVIDREPRDLTREDLEAFCDLAKMVEDELAAIQFATTDALTGLSNRRGFEVLAQQMLRLAARNQTPLALVSIDLDHFKEINDRFGHAEGDRALVQIARLLLETFRDSDVVGRLGGDEFCVLTSGAQAADARRPAERLQERVRSWNESSGARFDLACSIGVVDWDPARGAPVTELLAEADRLMYRDKQARKTRAANASAA